MMKKNSKFMQPMNLSPELAAVIGKGPFPRTQVTKKIWAYIKKTNKTGKTLGKRYLNITNVIRNVNTHLFL